MKQNFSPVAKALLCAVLSFGVATAAVAAQPEAAPSDSKTSQVSAGITTRDGSFGMYLAFDLSAGAEPKRPEKIQLAVSENYLAKFAGKSRKSAKLVDVPGCKHSPSAFKKFNEGSLGGAGKNDFSDILPIAVECNGDLSFLFLLYRDPAVAKTTADAFQQRTAKHFNWTTGRVAATWWASREQMIPLEDLSGVPAAQSKLTASLK